MRIAVVTTGSSSSEVGGAEALCDGLVENLNRAGHDTDAVPVPVDESSFEALLESYLSCYDLPLLEYDLVISTKAPTYMVRHPNHVSYLLHTPRVFYDMFAFEYGAGSIEQHRQQRTVHALDQHGLSLGRTRARFSIGHTPYERLVAADDFWRHVRFEILHPPPLLENFRDPRFGEYLFVPSRLHRWKRIDLLIRAFRLVRRDVPLVIAGAGEDEQGLRELAAGDPRIRLVGHVGDDELLELYAGAIAVPFVPIREDYGLVTIEAFRSGKPVLTCSDSGEPARFVRNGENGFVCPSDPRTIAERLTWLIDHPRDTAKMGRQGRRSVEHITWEQVVARLLEAGSARAREPNRPLRVLVTDCQPIEPAVGGGRLRLLGLYGTLREGVETTYIGTYDWRGPGRRELRLTPRLREIDVPLGGEHFERKDELERLLPGKTTIDVTVPWLVDASPELVETIRTEVGTADLAVFSHPWMYSCARDLVRELQIPLVYDSHNCEARLRREILGDSWRGRSIAEGVRSVEGQLCEEADLILACSEEDRDAFVNLYGVDPQKIEIFPNGVEVRSIRPASPEERTRAKKDLVLPGFTAVFVGSAYAPNAEAASEIVRHIAPFCPQVTFVIVGGAGEELPISVGPNVRILGAVDDETRNRAYAAADVALNPMRMGSGVSIKMLDYFAAGLATIATAVGARGIVVEEGPCCVVDELERFPEWLERLRAAPEIRHQLGKNARALAERAYDWRRISERLGDRLLRLADGGRRISASPFFSIVVPTWERPRQLGRLLRRLEQQTFRDFEIVVVDQSAKPADPGPLGDGSSLRYLHTDRRGAVRARNLGVRQARGSVIAFTDDDCEPAVDWLDRARPWFKDRGIAGLEGLIECDQTDESRYRIVTNVGFEGFGFMTANLFLRREVIECIGGFDERFDDPHFREDTDLAWRALAHGRIPFAREVRVLHPAHSRDDKRETAETRGRFFVQDPLLFHKHPDRYVDLVRAEGNHERYGDFWKQFMRGMIRHRRELPIEKLREFADLETFDMLQELSQMLRTGADRARHLERTNQVIP